MAAAYCNAAAGFLVSNGRIAFTRVDGLRGGMRRGNGGAGCRVQGTVGR